MSILLLFALAFLSGCGNGGSSGDTANAGSGTLGIFITDGPISDGTIKAVCVTYQQVELLGNGRYTLYQGEPHTFDLLQLRDHARPLSFNTVPAGDYDKIRLTLVDHGIELKLDDSDCGTPSEASAYPRLPGNNKLDFVVHGGIRVEPGAQVFFEFDMDAEKAVHVVATNSNRCLHGNHMDARSIGGNCSQFNFRSVVFIRALDRDYTGKLIRLVGTIESVNADDRSLRLCNALPGMQDNNTDGCVRVRVSADDAFFDSDGLPRPLQALQRAVGMQATVNGKLWSLMAPAIADEDRPPAGQCRIWDPGLPADQQSPPGDCAELWALVQDGQYLISADDLDQPLVIDALTIGLGETLLVEGDVVSAPVAVQDSTDQAFTMDVDRPDPLAVRLQAGVDGGNGTRIIDQRGNPLSADALFPPRPVRVDGVYDNQALLMRGELVVLLDPTTMGLTDTTRLSGSIGSIEPDGSAFNLVLDADDPDNASAVPSLSDQQVQVPADARILLVNITTGNSQPLTQEELAGAAGHYVNVYAVKPADGLGSWIADTVLVIDDSTLILTR